MRKSIPVLGIAAATVGLLVAGCTSMDAGTSSVEGETVLNVIGFSGTFEEGYKETVIAKFEDANPDIKINYVGSPTSGQSLATLKSGSANDIDVVLMDTSVAATANSEGIFAPLDPAIVTNLADIAPEAQIEGNYGPGLTWDSLVLVYNTSLADAEPTSWNDMWDPSYAGAVAFWYPPNSFDTAGFLAILSDMEGADYATDIGPAMKRLKDLAPAVQTWEAQPDAITLVGNGTAAISLGLNARAQYYVDEFDGAIATVNPVEGTVLQMNTINLTANSKNSDAAQKFINFAISPEAQAELSQTLYYLPTNTKTVLPTEVRERTAAAAIDADEIIPIDWTIIVSKFQEWLRIWQTEVVS